MSIRENLRAARRLFFFVFYVAGYLIEASLMLVLIRNEDRRRRALTKIVSRYCRVGLFLMNAKVTVKNKPQDSDHFLLVGNHLGFMDILVLASVKPVLFVTSVEMKNTPGLGTLCEMGGCLFVERRSRSNIIGEMGEIREVLQKGFSVALYPEGTSGNGARVLPFKKTLMVSAAGTGIPLKVMVINYRKLNGEPMSHKWRDYVCWYGDMGFAPSIWRLFSLKSLEVDLDFHEEVMVHSAEERSVIASRVQALVETHYDPIPFPEGVEPAPVVVPGQGQSGSGARSS